MPTWGSWNWIGADLAEELAKYFDTSVFSGADVPDCDAAIIVKHPYPLEVVAQAQPRSAVLYCPVDHYGQAGAIDADGAMLRKCTRVILHSETLRKYFEPYARVEVMDHHVKFASELPTTFKEEGYILWVGVRTNLEPLVEWVNANPLPRELRILTNLADPAKLPTPQELGFRRDVEVRIGNWAPRVHVEWTAGACAALDIKGSDFRSRHKPPTKAIDFLASGLPLAMNADSSAVEYLARMGFEVAAPSDPERWFARAYWQETQQFARTLRDLFSLERIGRRFRHILQRTLAERGMTA